MFAIVRPSSVLALAVVLTSCASGSAARSNAAPTAAPAAPGAPAATASPPVETVRLGALGSATDAAIFIALDQGYFHEQGLALDVTPFDSAARMVAPLGAGQLDVGGGSHSAGLFNAVARGIALKLVADKGSAPPGHGFQALLFRRDLMEGGQVQSPADLKGRTVALPAHGTSAEVALAEWLQQAGLTLDDIDVTELNFAEHLTALQDGAIDASVTIEPFLTRILDLGVAKVAQRVDQLHPGYQIAEVIYSGEFVQEHPDAARRFMIAYLRGARFYNDAFDHGDAAKRQAAIASLIQHTPVKDAALYDRMVMPGLDPNGRMNVDSLGKDQDFWLARGLQEDRADLSQVVDPSFAEAAVEALGPYQ